MRLLLPFFIICSCTIYTGNGLYAQLGVVDSGINKVSKFLLNLKPNTLRALDKQYAKTAARLTNQSDAYLKRLEKKEEKLKKRLAKSDSTKAQAVFGNVNEKYTALRAKLQQTNGKLQKVTHYIPGLDSISSASKYLSQISAKIPNYSPEKLQLLGQLNSNLSSLQQQMQSATDIKLVLSEREADLKQQLQNTILSNQLDGINKQVYYYQQQLNQYKELLNNPDKLAQKALTVLRETPVFQNFMSKYSMLAQLFPAQSNNANTPSLSTGLQTRAQVQQLIQNSGGSIASNTSLGVGGNAADPQSYMQQQMQSAQTQITGLKDKLNGMGGSSSDMIIPNFKPNNQKTKSFLKRIEYGLNIQSQKTNYFLPTTSDIAFTAGYKINDKSIVGIGASYKLGWGNGLNNISLSNQGMGLRSYLDIKLKGSIWITGGYEQNWLPQLSMILDSANVHTSGWGNGWQESGLLGLTKKYKIGKKTSNFQLLWDFLSYQQIPRTPELKFRIGYVL